jgi:hypothetical protein
MADPFLRVADDPDGRAIAGQKSASSEWAARFQALCKVPVLPARATNLRIHSSR